MKAHVRLAVTLLAVTGFFLLPVALLGLGYDPNFGYPASTKFCYFFNDADKSVKLECYTSNRFLK